MTATAQYDLAAAIVILVVSILTLAVCALSDLLGMAVEWVLRRRKQSNPPSEPGG